MPLLKQVKDLQSLCYSTLAFDLVQAIRRVGSNAKDEDIITSHVQSLPTSILESLLVWTVQSALGFASGCGDTDDLDILKEHSQLLCGIVKVMWSSEMKVIDIDSTIDLRQLGNFKELTTFGEVALEDLGIVAQDESLEVIDQVCHVAKCLVKLTSQAKAIRVFKPGLKVIGRPITDLKDPDTFSLSWRDPRIIINLVESCHQTLTVLNMEGYEDLNDLVLDFIAGVTEDHANEGLKMLEDITLPRRCFVTEHGVKTLLKHLPRLEYLRHQGKMGKVFDLADDDWRMLKIKHFSQMESIQSGGIDQEEEWNEYSDDFGDIRAWHPSAKALETIERVCSRVTKLKLLLEDQNFEKFCFMSTLQEIEAHVLWTGVSSLDLLAIVNADTLTKMDITLLEGYSWTVIASIGRACYNLKSFFLDIWTDDIDDHELINHNEPHFEALEELSIKSATELPPSVVFYFLSSGGQMTMLQVIAPLSWLCHSILEMWVTSGCVQAMEMIILSNTSPDPMPLGIHSVHLLLDACPRLCLLGSLKTWRRIDHYDPSSPGYYRSESDLTKLKTKAKESNWDLDLDTDCLDALFITHS